jgi:hypothetical protein
LVVTLNSLVMCPTYGRICPQIWVTTTRQLGLADTATINPARYPRAPAAAPDQQPWRYGDPDPPATPAVGGVRDRGVDRRLLVGCDGTCRHACTRSTRLPRRSSGQSESHRFAPGGRPAYTARWNTPLAMSGGAVGSGIRSIVGSSTDGRDPGLPPNPASSGPFASRFVGWRRSGAMPAPVRSGPMVARAG